MFSWHCIQSTSSSLSKTEWCLLGPYWGPVFQNRTDTSEWIKQQCVGTGIPGNLSVFKSQMTTSEKTWRASQEGNTAYNVDKSQHSLIIYYRINGMPLPI